MKKRKVNSDSVISFKNNNKNNIVKKYKDNLVVLELEGSILSPNLKSDISNMKLSDFHSYRAIGKASEASLEGDGVSDAKARIHLTEGITTPMAREFLKGPIEAIPSVDYFLIVNKVTTDKATYSEIKNMESEIVSLAREIELSVYSPFSDQEKNYLIKKAKKDRVKVFLVDILISIVVMAICLALVLGTLFMISPDEFSEEVFRVIFSDFGFSFDNFIKYSELFILSIGGLFFISSRLETHADYKHKVKEYEDSLSELAEDIDYLIALNIDLDKKLQSLLDK